MLKLIIGNKAYSSWSLRGWLAVRHSGLPFEEVVLPLYDEAWPNRREAADLAPSGGKVPILWDGDVASWNSLGIIDHLDRLTGGTRFWPRDPAARALAMSMATEMQSSYLPLRKACPMNVRRHYPEFELPDDARADTKRIDRLWTNALERSGGPFLFGEWGAVDMMFAPVASRLTSYAVDLSAPADAYRAGVMAHPDMVDWIDGAHKESWVLDQYEF